MLGREVEKFKAHAEANDRRAVNWNAAFTQWLIRSAEYAGQNAPKPDRRVVDAPVELPPDGLTDAEMAAWHAARRAR